MTTHQDLENGVKFILMNMEKLHQVELQITYSKSPESLIKKKGRETTIYFIRC